MAVLNLCRITFNPGATPSPSPVRAINVQNAARAILNVTFRSTQDTIMVANVTISDSVSAGKHHIELILSAGFIGTIGDITIRSHLGVYPSGNTQPKTISWVVCLHGHCC